MKVLIAVSTCWDCEKWEWNRVMRECWLKDCAKVGFDYKMFVGCGQGAETADLPKDTVLLPDVEDDYGHLSYKTRSSLRWAAERNYDFVFRCFPDTYCRPERLTQCGFRDYDYYGDFRGEHATPDNYPSGGCGAFASRKAYCLALDAPIEGAGAEGKHTRVWPYAEDLWLGQVLNWHRDLGLKYFDDNRFVNRGTTYPGPLASNQVISTHLSCPERYHPGRMQEKHTEWLNSFKCQAAVS